MTVLYLTEYNTTCYGVFFRNRGCIEVRNFKDISNDEVTTLCMKPLKTLLDKSETSSMTCMTGAFNKSVFDGNIFLREISEENDSRRYVYICGYMVCSFLTKDDFRQYISNMGNNITPYSIATVEENI